MVITVIVFVAILAVLILVHELGHFLFAKKANIKVLEFGIGFPPRVWYKKVKETIYSINLIPVGGFVSMFGEQGGHDKEKRSFGAQSIWSRAKVIVAGVLMNFLLAFILLIIYFAFSNPPMATDPTTIVGQDKIEFKTLVMQVEEGSAAAKAGIQEGDFIYKIDNQEIETTDQLIDYTATKPNQKIKVTFGPNGETKTTSTVLDKIDGKGRLGVLIGQAYGQIQYSWWQVIVMAFSETFRIMGLIFYYIYKILARLIIEGQVEEGVAGPVGIFMLTKQMVSLGSAAILRFIAFLSINLGVINLLPFPGLDGGQLVLLIFEKIRGKKIRESVERGLQIFGFSFLIILIILITYRDVVRLF